ncbi:Scarecrow-like protein 6 [Acorus gramineus]|uniref:Scarecrow-like protein 6 n=1 Tax=Acorus gramineus TaxID=55184 RepID=A0AAV9BAB5_ACOGR|nr:Scarecrow-like protein 6 [Acorus gramineus]
MRGMPFRLEGKGVLEAVVAAAAAAKAAEGEVLSAVAAEEKWKKEGSGEPTSVLDTRRSPSPPTSSSTLSSSLGGGGGGGDASGGVAAVSQKWTTTSPPPSELADGAGGGGGGKDNNEWGLEPIPAGLGIGGGGGVSAGEDCWESLLSASGASSPGHDPAYLRYFFQEVEAHPQQQYLLSLGGSSAVQDFDSSGGGGGNGGLGFSGLIDQGFGFEPPPTPLSGFPMMGSTAKFPNNPVFPPLQIHQGMFCQDGLAAPPVEEKPPPPQLFMNPQQAQSCQNPTLFHPFPYTQQEQLVLPPPLKRLHTMEPSPQPQLSQAGVLPYSTNQRQAMKPKAAMAGVEENQQQQQQRQIVVDQLYKAAELVETGNSSSARGILARLNHQLSSSPNNSLLGKPLLRAAVLFKDALLHLIDHPSPAKGAAFTISPSAPVTPLDVVFKISAYKVFSEISPVAQFSMFTANQAILDELSVARHIHVLDFDIGIGGQWASFLQELSLRGTNSTVSLRITAFASPSSTHPLELALTKESLAHFAGDLGISFEFNVVNLDSFSPAMTVPIVSPDEVVAVNLPVGPLVTPAILRFVKQLGPRIVVSVDHGSVGGGGGGGELAFSNRFLHALQSHAALLDSINAAGADPEAARWIETFLVRPWIEAAVAMGRHRDMGDRPQHLPWRSLFALAGFAPAAVSNFTETQAECLIKRVQVREFHVEKRNASALVLCWQRVELVSVSAWRC